MGLDITAYRKLVLAPEAVVDSDGYPVDYDKHWRPTTVNWTNENWPGRAEPIIDRSIYTFAESFGFRAGSYSGYGWWRRNLAHLVGFIDIERAWDCEDNYRFKELINFADNEGVIGSIAAASLAKDFAEKAADAEKFSAALEGGSYWLAKYRDWKKASEMAADGGAIDFH